MALFISQDTIEEIKNRLRIEEIIGEYIHLKKKGKDFLGLCPFHGEKTPSFSVVPQLGFYKCFGCDAKGDTITFLMQHHSISYVEALHLLAERYGITIEKKQVVASTPDEKKEKDVVYDLLSTAQAYYHELLSQKVQAEQARKYLDQRGITTNILEKFGIGYSLHQWRDFHDYAIKKGYTTTTLHQAGLIVTKEKSLYDRFRGRIMFPIHDLAGRVIAFGARRLDNNADTPKYMNSPETLTYKKSQILYGLYQAKKAIKEQGFCYLVEGYTDVLALHIHGLAHVVASSGTSLTHEQIKLLSRFTQKITLLFDNDTAGSTAMLKGIDLLLAHGLDIKVVNLPPGEDPDSYARKRGKIAFIEYVQKYSEDFITFKVHKLLSKHAEDLTTRQQALEAMVETLSCIPNVIKRALYVERCTKLFNLSAHVLEQAINDFQRKNKIAQKYEKKLAKGPIDFIKAPKERTVLYILLHYASYRLDEGRTCGDYLLEELNEDLFPTLTYKKIFQKFKSIWQKNNNLTSKQFIDMQEEKLKQVIIDLMANRHKPGAWQKYYQIQLPKEHDNLDKWCLKSVQYLKLHDIQQRMRQNRQALQLANSDQEVDMLLLNYQALQKKAQQIAKSLSIVITPV